MTDQPEDVLWRTFPKTAIEFERRFASEADCRAYWIEAHWGGKPACAVCKSTRVWEERGGTLFECADCGHQTSLTAGTLLERTRKPLKVWFRAIFEIAARRNGISAKELQRIMGFGSYRTAWTWLHKLRAALAPEGREPLGPFVQVDETLVGGKGGPHKELVLMAAEAGGRVRHHVLDDARTTDARCPDGTCPPQPKVQPATPASLTGGNGIGMHGGRHRKPEQGGRKIGDQFLQLCRQHHVPPPLVALRADRVPSVPYRLPVDHVTAYNCSRLSGIPLPRVTWLHAH